ncbi:unnamed protein product [Gongylonema pulchrum]|uniref:PHM7_ext domain-containing protein n=1 Tax=Gongylonema pulchrum TaxID=637853 RepID=A0A183CY82_9BILA|nr:unnamed protein product [Gongylonema pulchrum]
MMQDKEDILIWIDRAKETPVSLEAYVENIRKLQIQTHHANLDLNVEPGIMTERYVRRSLESEELRDESVCQYDGFFDTTVSHGFSQQKRDSSNTSKGSRNCQPADIHETTVNWIDHYFPFVNG